MPVVSGEIWNVLYTVSRYLFPLLALAVVFLILFFTLSEGRLRREKARSLPGFGTVGELIVLSGSRDLDANTWFPVPREGVLGSVRSCDLVIPCPGVHTKHLDFSWQDGLGLLVRPRTGCEALVNGIPVTCRTNAADFPLQHGSVLQVGSAVLRLHLFAALDNTPAPDYLQNAPEYVQPQLPDYLPPVPGVPVTFTTDVFPPEQTVLPDQMAFVPQPSVPGVQPIPGVSPVPPEPESATEQTASARSDRWEEDFGE